MQTTKGEPGYQQNRDMKASSSSMRICLPWSTAQPCLACYRTSPHCWISIGGSWHSALFCGKLRKNFISLSFQVNTVQNFSVSPSFRPFLWTQETQKIPSNSPYYFVRVHRLYSVFWPDFEGFCVFASKGLLWLIAMNLASLACVRVKASWNSLWKVPFFS